MTSIVIGRLRTFELLQKFIGWLIDFHMQREARRTVVRVAATAVPARTTGQGTK